MSFKSRTVLFFLAALLIVPLVWGRVLTDESKRSRFEKRSLAILPEINNNVSIKEYFSRLDNYLQDHVGFAVPINRYYRKVIFMLFNESRVKNISIGKDGYVFLTSHNPNQKNTVFKDICDDKIGDDFINQQLDRITSISRIITSFGHRAIFTVPISKPTLYPEKLPKDVTTNVLQNCKKFSHDNPLIVLRNRALSENVIFHYPYEDFQKLKTKKSFYPKENFHWNGFSPHYFSKLLFEKLRVTVPEEYDSGSFLGEDLADLKSLGFERKIQVWKYPYKHFNLVNSPHEKRDIIKPYYERIRDCSYYTNDNSLMDRYAILISNSFGAFTAKHLSVGYKTLLHININHLKKDEMVDFFDFLLNRKTKYDIIFLFHDAAMLKENNFENIQISMNQIAKVKPEVTH